MLLNDLPTMLGVGSLLLAAIGVYLAIIGNATVAEIHRLLRDLVCRR